MFQKLKKFLLYLRYDVSKSFLYSQAAFDQIFIDKIYSIFKCKSKNFDNIVDKVSVDSFEDEREQIIKLYEKTKRERVNNFSDAINLDYIPNVFLNIIQKHKHQIKDYLGDKVLYEKVTFFRNYNFDKRFSAFDIYSNVWHQDSHDGNKLLKIFLLMHDVEDDDGPLRWLDEENTKKNWNELADRWSFKKLKKVNIFENENYLTGRTGTYCIIDTSRCVHRAGIPKVKRDIIQLTLYPSWRKKDERFEQKL